MKAIQIVMRGDERSEEYAALSRQSFQRAIDEGYIDSIETFDAITPQSDMFQEHVDKYTWSKSLMTLDLISGKEKEDHSPTEKVGCVLTGNSCDNRARHKKSSGSWNTTHG